MLLVTVNFLAYSQSKSSQTSKIRQLEEKNQKSLKPHQSA